MSDDDDPPTPAREGDVATQGPGPDVAILGAPTERGVQILRMRQGQVELGELRAAEEGKPILGESVRLRPREDREGLYDVETLARGPLATRVPTSPDRALPARKGPAKVATEAYRAGWESIFRGRGGEPGGGDLPN